MKRNPYYSFSQYIRENFNTKAYRVSIDAFFGCKENCIYCEEHYRKPSKLKIEEQVDSLIPILKGRYKAKDFYLYFQKGTNTDANVRELKKLYDKVLSYEDFIGLIIGTRPDYVNKKIINLINSYTERYDTWIEYGLQSSHNSTLKKIQRGHTYEDFLKAIELTEDTDIKITVHLIIGLPGESKEDVIKTVRRISNLPIHGVKFHHLYILKGTPLYQLYLKNKYKPLDYKSFKDILIESIENLREDIVIHRIIGEDHSDHFVGPQWEMSKNQIINDIRNTMKKNNRFQGRLF